MAPKIAIVYYSMYGHVYQLAQAEQRGIQEAGGEAKIFKIPETLSEEALGKLGAKKEYRKDNDVPDITPEVLAEFDAFLFGIPTRYGNFPAQWKIFWDHTGGQWMKGGYWGKYAGIFVSTASLGGGQESTVLAAMSTLAHHGIIFVPLGFKPAASILSNVSEVRGGSAWGAGTFAGLTGERQPSKLEIELAETQGKAFFETVSKVNFGGGS